MSWKTAKGMMAEGGFLSSLMNMDVDGISIKQVRVRWGYGTQVGGGGSECIVIIIIKQEQFGRD